MEQDHVEVDMPEDLEVPLACRHAASPKGLDQDDGMMRVVMMKRYVSESEVREAVQECGEG